MKKTIYISGFIRDKFPKIVTAIEAIATTPFSKYKILPEAKKDRVLATAQGRAQAMVANGKRPTNQTRNIWLVSSHEREDDAGIRIVMNVPMFIDYATCIDRNLTLTGLCGH